MLLFQSGLTVKTLTDSLIQPHKQRENLKSDLPGFDERIEQRQTTIEQDVPFLDFLYRARASVDNVMTYMPYHCHHEKKYNP